MKKVFLFFFLLNILCFSQTYKFGGSLHFAFPTETMEVQFGPSLNLALSYKDLPVIFLANVRYLFGEGATWLNTKSIGIGAAYVPAKDSKVLPYISLSFFLNDYGLDQEHVGRDIHITSLPLNLSTEIAGGINLNPKSETLQVLVEVSYSYNRPKYRYYLVRYDQNNILEGNLEYSAVYFRLDFLFNI